MVDIYSYQSGNVPFNSTYVNHSQAKPGAQRPQNDIPPIGRSLSKMESMPNDTFVRRSSATDSSSPDLVFKKFTDLTPENVRTQGNIRGMIFDIDDTLSKYKLGNDRSIPPELKAQLKTLQDSGIMIGVISNNSDSGLIQQFQQELSDAGIQAAAISNGQKPDTKSLKMMQQAMGLPANQIMMVGDNPNTDIASGKNAGFKTGLADWFGNSTLRKEAMQLGDKAKSFFDDFTGIFKSNSDQPKFFPPPASSTIDVMA